MLLAFCWLPSRCPMLWLAYADAEPLKSCADGHITTQIAIITVWKYNLQNANLHFVAVLIAVSENGLCCGCPWTMPIAEPLTRRLPMVHITTQIQSLLLLIQPNKCTFHFMWLYHCRCEPRLCLCPWPMPVTEPLPRLPHGTLNTQIHAYLC